MKKASWKQYLVGISILSLLFIGLLVNHQFAIGNSSGKLRPSPTSTPKGRPLDSYIASLQEELKDPQLDPDRRKEIEESLQYFAEMEILRQTEIPKVEAILSTEMVAASKNPARPRGGFIITGIRNDRFLLPGSDIVNENAWQELVDGEYVAVYAGYQKNDPSLGEVCFATETTPITCIYSPDKTGSLRIIEHKEKESKLILKSKDGKQYFFDIRGRKFAKSLDEVVPTITPEDKDKDKKTPVATTPADYPAP